MSEKQIGMLKNWQLKIVQKLELIFKLNLKSIT